MITREFNLYLHAGHSIPLVINVNQYDRGEQWLFTLFNSDGTKYVPSSGAIVGIKSDKLGIINSGTVDSQGRVVINETQQMTAAVGKAVFELLIDDQTHGTANFVVLVEPKPGDNASLSESDLSLIQEALNATSPLPTGGTVGQVLTKTANGSAWSDAGTPTQEQVAEAVSDWADENITVETGVVIDNSLSVSGAAADAKKTGDEISELKSQIALNSGIPRAVKLALDNLLQNVAFKNDTDYSSDKSVVHAWATSINLVSISAVYTQSGTVYDTDSLDGLKSDLVVTASYDDGTSATVSGYTLSGALEIGTSTITVTYEGKTATFSVIVSDSRRVPSEYTWLYEAKNGQLLSANSNVTKVTGGAGGTETLDDGILVLHADAQASSSGSSNFLRYNLSDTTTTNGKLSCYAKIVDGYIIPTGANTALGYRMQLSNGTSGAQAFLADTNGLISVCYYTGATFHSINTDYSTDDYHLFELELKNGHQIFSIDGTQVFDSSTLSTNYCTASAIFNQAGEAAKNPNGITTDIDWIAYYEVA